MLALTNSLRQSTSRSVFVTGMTGDLRQLRFLLGVKWTSMPVSAGRRVYAVNGQVAQVRPVFGTVILGRVVFVNLRLGLQSAFAHDYSEICSEVTLVVIIVVDAR